MANICFAPAVTRAMRILEMVARSQRGVTLSDVSRKLEIPKSSAHVLMKTLEAMGYLKSSHATGRYCFGMKLVSLSNMALENLDLRELARPFLEQLMLRTGLTVHLAILEGAEAVLIEKIQAPGMLRLATWVGKRLDANSSGVGKALLAFAEGDCDHRFTGRPMTRHNRNTISSLDRLARELRKVRELGYAFEDEEGEIGFRCIGVPVYDANDRAVAAISVAGTTAQITNERVTDLISNLKGTARQISTRLGCVRDLEPVGEAPD